MFDVSGNKRSGRVEVDIWFWLEPISGNGIVKLSFSRCKPFSKCLHLCDDVCVILRNAKDALPQALFDCDEH